MSELFNTMAENVAANIEAAITQAFYEGMLVGFGIGIVVLIVVLGLRSRKSKWKPAKYEHPLTAGGVPVCWHCGEKATRQVGQRNLCDICSYEERKPSGRAAVYQCSECSLFFRRCDAQEWKDLPGSYVCLDCFESEVSRRVAAGERSYYASTEELFPEGSHKPGWVAK